MNGGADDDDLLSDARRWGFDPAQLAPPEAGGVWVENENAVRAFLAVASQWRMLGSVNGGVLAIGLDYQGARAGFALAKMKMTPDLWAGVQMIEAGAVAALNGKLQ